jgi:hypothetical protein
MISKFKNFKIKKCSKIIKENKIQKYDNFNKYKLFENPNSIAIK